MKHPRGIKVYPYGDKLEMCKLIASVMLKVRSDRKEILSWASICREYLKLLHPDDRRKAARFIQKYIKKYRPNPFFGGAL